jgi:hypothetical protein
MNCKTLLSALSATVVLAGMAGIAALASSHSDAPLIKLDPQANLTDVYAFIRQRPNGQKVLVVEVNVHPFCEPGDGVVYDAFANDARYSIHITNPTTGAEVQRYDFKFSPVDVGGNYKNLNTILRYGLGTEVGPINDVGDARQNFVQTYTITRVIGKTSTVLNAGQTLMVPPPNVGLRTTPFYNDPVTGKAISGATSFAGLDRYTQQTTYTLPSGISTFAGLREDSFFADIPGIFDLLNPRILDNNGNLGDGLGQDGNGVDGFKGYNVLHYALVIPVSDLPSFAYTAPFPSRTSNGIGVYASVSRSRLTLRRAERTFEGYDSGSSDMIQVNRLANPLFNEGLVALADKDKYNRTAPTGDAAFAQYALNPEIAVLINTVYGTNFATTNRTDLAAVYIPDVIRVDTTTGKTNVAGDAAFHRLSFIGGETIMTSGGTAIPAGWPNGRRFGDDVVDIALTAIASGPTYTNVTVVGDNVHSNDQVYNQVFPYAATPHSGARNEKDNHTDDFIGF